MKTSHWPTDPQQVFQWCGVVDEANVGMKTLMPKHATISVDKLRQVSVGLNANAVKQLRTRLGMSLRVKVKYILNLSNGCVHARMLQMADVNPQKIGQ